MHIQQEFISVLKLAYLNKLNNFLNKGINTYNYDTFTIRTYTGNKTK